MLLIGVASTKAYTSQIIAITMIALQLGQDRISTTARRKEIIQVRLVPFVVSTFYSSVLLTLIGHGIATNGHKRSIEVRAKGSRTGEDVGGQKESDSAWQRLSICYLCGRVCYSCILIAIITLTRYK